MTGKTREKIYENKHDAVNDFIQRKEAMGRSRRTLNAYSRTLKSFFHEEFPNLAPEDVTPEHIEDYVSTLAARDLSQNTKRRYLESLSSFYGWTMKRPRFEDITGNPAAVVLEEIPQKYRERPDCATWESAKKIVHNIADPRNKAIAVILAKTGCRIREALEIEQDDLMLDDGFIRLRERKGGSQTVVPVDEEVKHAIKRYRLVRPDNDSEYLFLSIQGNRVQTTQVQRAVRDAAVRAGVMDEGETRFHRKFTPHTFRTVFTTLMRNQGMKDHILQYIRGDSNNRTIDVYTRVSRDEAKREYLECIESLDL
ncbi:MULTISPECIES: tyrosine-type recombinase/integrase [unclassified Haloferax]|uniref:tyrosine-type recombinase/integrase n=1 Tax=unclassified Haloferax TaxID=2625095 RepID=UPI000E25AE7B|nr:MULTISPECIES: tyrosine-type recombinase/integrase [unclassified Haloferax]RDZ35086.1 integrase [Haloferax sp. Atlit-24N]RLM35497.1 integrase [Haloferax sp. Atlit-109R]RLM43342.1 integrase [Haloferax sp. Atlit-105R]